MSRERLLVDTVRGYRVPSQELGDRAELGRRGRAVAAEVRRRCSWSSTSSRTPRRSIARIAQHDHGRSRGRHAATRGGAEPPIPSAHGAGAPSAPEARSRSARTRSVTRHAMPDAQDEQGDARPMRDAQRRRAACALRGGARRPAGPAAAPTLRGHDHPRAGRRRPADGPPTAPGSSGRRGLRRQEVRHRLLVGELSVDPAHVRAQLLAGRLDRAAACSARMRWKFSWPARFSAIHSRAKSPDWISPRMLLHRRLDVGRRRRAGRG